ITLNTSAVIKGDARCGPTGAVTLSNGATVTGRTAPLPQTMTFPSVTLPATYTDLGNITQSTGTNSFPGGVYKIGALNLSGTAHITWTGPVTLYIGTSYSVTNSAAIDTYQNNPANRTLYFLPTCTTATWSGTNVCIG